MFETEMGLLMVFVLKRYLERFKDCCAFHYKGNRMSFMFFGVSSTKEIFLFFGRGIDTYRMTFPVVFGCQGQLQCLQGPDRIESLSPILSLACCSRAQPTLYMDVMPIAQRNSQGFFFSHDIHIFIFPRPPDQFGR